MTFDNLHENTECNCTSKSQENLTDFFARKVGKAKTELKERDFKTHHERGIMASVLDDCSEVCGKRGLSIDIWNEQTKESILQRFMTTFAISPKLKNHLSIIKFKKGAGVVKHTPVLKPIPNKHHHDFYKSDNFNLDLIELIELIPLKQNV